MSKSCTFSVKNSFYKGNLILDFLIFTLKNNKKIILYFPLILFYYIFSKNKFNEKTTKILKKIPNINDIAKKFWEENKKINPIFIEKIKKEKVYILSENLDLILKPYANKTPNVKLSKEIKGKIFYTEEIKNLEIFDKTTVYYKEKEIDIKEASKIKDKKIALLISIIFFTFYLLLGIFAYYNYDLSHNNNLFFGSDNARIFTDFSSILDDHYRVKVHPLYIILVQPLILMLNAVTQNSTISLIIFSSFVSSLSVYFIYKIATLFDISSKIKALVSAMFGFTFAYFIFTSGVEVYNVAALFLIILFYYFIKIMQKESAEKKDKTILILLGITTIGFTITNYIIFLIISLMLLISRKLKFKNIFLINVLVIISAVILSFVQNIAWNNTSLIYDLNSNYTEEQNYMDFNINFDKFKNVVKNSYINSFVSSNIELNKNTPDGAVMSFGKTSTLSIILAFTFYLIILIYLIKNFKKNKCINIALILALIFNTTLHMIYGENSFLYSCHFMYLIFILFFVNYKEKTKVNKILTPILILILIGEILNNLYIFKKILRIENLVLTPNVLRSNFTTPALILLTLLFITLFYILIFNIYKQIKANKKPKSIITIIIFIFIMQLLFININTAEKYNRLLGFKFGPKEEKQEISLIPEKIQKEFKKESKSYLKYNNEYQEYVSSHNTILTDIGDFDYYFFGMGSRAKLLYKDGKLTNIQTKEVLYSWDVDNFLIIPNDYTVVLITKDGKKVKIEENENGIYVNDEVVDNTYIDLEDFKDQKYQNIKKTLYGELLFNIENSVIKPNIIVYENAWYRDAAMVAMALNQTNNISLIKDWIDNITDIYDNQNGNKEPDNLGELLYLLSFSENQNNLIQKIKDEAKEKGFTANTDGAKHEIYQKKWYNFGLNALNEKRTVSIKGEEDSYEALAWWYNPNKYNGYFKNNISTDYPYLSIAQYHTVKQGQFVMNKNVYPLSFERNASMANYDKMDVLGDYYKENRISPVHSWTAAELFLLIMDETGDLK